MEMTPGQLHDAKDCYVDTAVTRRTHELRGGHLHKGEDALDVHRDLGVAVHAIPLQVVVLVHIEPIPVVCHNLQHTSCVREELLFVVKEEDICEAYHHAEAEMHAGGSIPVTSAAQGDLLPIDIRFGTRKGLTS